MKRNSILYCLLVFVGPLYSQIIADHTIVDDYKNIPQQYIDSVKRMWVSVAGESHSSGYRRGLNFLETEDTIFKVNVRESEIPDPATDTNLRFSRGTWGDVNHTTGWIYGYGEEDWFTSDQAITQTKAGLLYCNTNNFKLDALGFGWCWDMTATNDPGGEIDTVFQVR